MKPGARPQFGVARPMQGGGGSKPSGDTPPPPGGEQFPPLPGEGSAPPPPSGGGQPSKNDAMARLADRANQVHSGEADVGGFEASVHKIKEQV
ncbi:MAG: CpaF family protein, partial [Sphingomonadaceae bacterium]|nr:CpaF family protein [Sphingomonadaceae bacterium]